MSCHAAACGFTVQKRLNGSRSRLGQKLGANKHIVSGAFTASGEGYDAAFARLLCHAFDFSLSQHICSSDDADEGVHQRWFGIGVQLRRLRPLTSTSVSVRITAQKQSMRSDSLLVSFGCPASPLPVAELGFCERWRAKPFFFSLQQSAPSNPVDGAL